MWGLGDAGFLWSFDARTGDNPCRVGKQAVELVSPTAFYCDGKPGHVQGWDAVRFVSSHLDDFAEIRVTLLDSTGAPVPGFTDVALPLTGPDAGVLDISSIPVTGATSTLTAQFVVNAPNNDPWADEQPFAEISFIGDPPQICFQTTLAQVCITGSTIDQANATTNDTAVESNLITVQIQPLPAGCTPTLTKTADQSPVPAGSVIGFTISLANPGPNALPGLTLTDPLPAGSGVNWAIANQQGPATCTITGAPPTQTLDCGTFTLAAGQSQIVHVTSGDGPDACAVLDNTATATSPIVGDETGHDSITVLCPTAVTTTPSAAQVSLGTPIHDTVVVTDGNPVPTGTVSFALYGPGDTTCLTNLVGGPGIRQRGTISVGRRPRATSPRPPRVFTSGLSATAAIRCIRRPRRTVVTPLNRSASWSRSSPRPPTPRSSPRARRSALPSRSPTRDRCRPAA